MYFYDTYALIEIIKGNLNFDKFKEATPICIIQNLFELHQALLRDFNKKTADYWINKFDYKLLEILKEDIIKASDFRFKHNKLKLSMTDCLGYILAKKNKLKFLTGDEKFEDFEYVEFVK
ncbi:PIN domain-containing protein [Candidatus Pacearchaeota archaeon]|nr:PIN domain-containing protein [Candidatus Pacearchaeota archaeon]MBI2057332.1 PIN domain-containing protein [Candidatus Pacearchaeota archaeon]